MTNNTTTPASTPTPPVLVTLPRFHVNQSRIKSFNSCPRMYAWEYIQNLVPDRKRWYLETGTAVHAAMEHAHTHGATPTAFTDAIDIALDTFTTSVGPPQLDGDEAEIKKQLTIIQRIIAGYHAHYGTTQHWKSLGLEVSFCVEVGEDTNVYLVGRVDNLVSYQNNIWLVDYKTMSKLDMRDFLKYENDIQLTAYIYGATKELTQQAQAKNQPPVIVRGAIIDGMVKTASPQYHREFYTRTVEDLRAFELEFCMRAWDLRSKHAMSEGDRATYDALCARMYELGKSNWKLSFPTNTDNCFRYGTCVYRDPCIRDNPTRRAGYVSRTPDYVDEARNTSDETT